MPPAIPISPHSKNSAAKQPALRWARAGVTVLVVIGMCFGVVALLSKHVRDLSPEEVRARMGADKLPLDTAIEQLQRMDIRDRREVMRSPEAQGYFQKLKPDQRMRLVNETLDRGIRQQIERYRKLNKDERKAFIDEMLQVQAEERERLQNMSPEERAKMNKGMDAANLQEIVENAMKAYLSASTSEERSELAPLFDGALDNLQTARGLK